MEMDRADSQVIKSSEQIFQNNNIVTFMILIGIQHVLFLINAKFYI